MISKREIAIDKIVKSTFGLGFLVSLMNGTAVVSFDPRQSVGTLEGDLHNQLTAENRARHKYAEIIWLYEAGYIDQFGIVTPEGRAAAIKIATPSQSSPKE